MTTKMDFLNDGAVMPRYFLTSAAMGNAISQKHIQNGFDAMDASSNSDVIINARYCQTMLQKTLSSIDDINIDTLKRCYWNITNWINLSDEADEMDQNAMHIIKFIKIMIKCIENNKIKPTDNESNQLFGSIYFLLYEIHLNYDNNKITKRILKDEIYHYHKGWYYWSRRNVAWSKLITLKLMDYFYVISKYETNPDILIKIGRLYLKGAKKLFAEYDRKNTNIAHILPCKYPVRDSRKWTYYFIAVHEFFFKALTFEGFELCIKYILKGLKTIKKTKKILPSEKMDIYLKKDSILENIFKLFDCLSFTNKFNKEYPKKYKKFIKFLNPKWLDQETEKKMNERLNIIAFDNLLKVFSFKEDNYCKWSRLPLINEREHKLKLNPMCDSIVQLLSEKNGIVYIENVLSGKYCLYCGEKAIKLKLCSKCKIVTYCNRNHQKKHWNKQHRNLCCK